MPELPEVETTRRGIEPHILQQTVKQVIIRQRQLRWPITRGLAQKIAGQHILAVERRGKYLLLRFAHGTLMMHLGMSGSLRIVAANMPAAKHDHVDICFTNGQCLRFHDPRRFGAILWTSEPVENHELIQHLGPEPLSEAFSGELLFQNSRKRQVAIKNFIMNSRQVVGVGNIYANEALFLAGIHPKRAAGKISRQRYERLAQAIKQVLRDAIAQGGTTLRDFVGGDGKPGYFSQQLKVYGREGEACDNCGAAIRQEVIGQRSSYFCPHCQT